MQIHVIDSLEHPDLWAYRTMRWSARHEEEGVFVAEGEKVVRHLLGSRLQLRSLLLTEQWLAAVEPLLRGRPDLDTLRVYRVEPDQLDELTGLRLHQRILACARIPDAESLEAVLSRAARPWLLAAADNLANAENLGAFIRNAAAFDATAVLVGEACGQPWLRRVVRTSMGFICSLPVLARQRLGEVIPVLQRLGVCCVAAHPTPASCDVSRLDLGGDVCLVFGGEGHGLTREVVEVCDVSARIPMKPGFDSLNVVSATGILLHEVARQQGRVTGPGQ